MELRPYQKEAIQAINGGWDEFKKQLLVLPTGCGKTIVFTSIAHEEAEKGNRVLILAHRDELIEQARDKYYKVTGDGTGKEKAGETCLNSLFPVSVGSVQTLQREARLNAFSPDYFSLIIVDEAHHVASEGYQRVLTHFPAAKLLGVTATPDRGDKKALALHFDRIAYEYSLRDAIQDGYLCPIKAKTVPLQIDLSKTKVKLGDYEVTAVAETLEPYLDEIAEAMAKECRGRKTVAFLPLISISQELRDKLKTLGVDAREVNGNSPNRKETLEWFDKAGPGAVLCNALLLTEGWDCPSCDCVVMLRPTKIRALYSQAIGRGTRLAPGKKDLLILDFLWLSTKHDLCRPASLVSRDKKDEEWVTAKGEKTGEEIDLLEADTDAVEERRRKLAEELAANARKKARVLDPIQWAITIDGGDILDYAPEFQWEKAPPTARQLSFLAKQGFSVEAITCKGLASMLIGKVMRRIELGLASPKQVRLLEKYGYQDVSMWPKELAKQKIYQLELAGWKPWKLTEKPGDFKGREEMTNA